MQYRLISINIFFFFLHVRKTYLFQMILLAACVKRTLRVVMLLFIMDSFFCFEKKEMYQVLLVSIK